MQYLARIKPTSKRDTQVVDGRTYRKRRGWYGPIGEQLAQRLRDLPESDLNPAASPNVFDVMERAEAAQAEQAEQRQEEPAGTVDAPVEPPPPAAPPPPRQSSRGRRSHSAGDIDATSSSGRRRRSGRGKA